MVENLILAKLQKIERLVENQSILQKDVLNFEEASWYLSMSKSYLYKLTSNKGIPYYCPRGKQVFFKKEELDNWLLQNPKVTK